MSDKPDDTATETPMRRALRLRKAALESNPGTPKGMRPPPAPEAGASKPWMKK